VWYSGRALEFALSLNDMRRLHLPWGLEHSALMTALTYGTLAVELALGVLIFLPRRARPAVLAAGIGLHLGIDALMNVALFSAVMIGGYVAFVDFSALTSRRKSA
jgi:hypothetical protein